jgi:hypothetical protein
VPGHEKPPRGLGGDLHLADISPAISTNVPLTLNGDVNVLSVLIHLLHASARPNKPEMQLAEAIGRL